MFLTNSHLNSYPRYTGPKVVAPIATSDKKNITPKVLGYEVDEKGYFKSDFNKAAGIPEDFKIHSDTMISVVDSENNASGFYKMFYSIDIAKTIGNAYKVLTQLVDEETLSKESFTNEDIANIPQGYTYDKTTLQVKNIQQTAAEYMSEESVVRGRYNNNNTSITTTFYNHSTMNFWNTPQGSGILKPSSTSDMFSNNVGGKEGGNGLYFNSHKENYINSDGSVTKGGLLVGIMNSNIFIKEGETTFRGKEEGFDKQITSKQAHIQDALFSMLYPSSSMVPKSVLESLPPDFRDYVQEEINMQESINPGSTVYYNGKKDSDDEDEKSPLEKLLDQMRENQKEMIERIKKSAEEAREEEKKQTQKEYEQRLIEQSKVLDEFIKAFLKTQEELNASTPSWLQTDITKLELENTFLELFGLKSYTKDKHLDIKV